MPFGLVPPAQAQEEAGPEEMLRVVPQADGDAYVYHTKDLPARYGFVVYREHEGAESRITETPVRGVQSAAALEDSLSRPLLGALQDRLDVPSSLEAYYELRADRTTALRFAFTDPVLARLLGYLHVDEEAPQGTVTYRAEFTGPSGEPTGEEMTQTVEVPGEQPAAPTDLSATHDANQLTLSWSYPTTSTAIPDNVATFRVYRKTPSGREQVTPNALQLRRVRKNEQTQKVPTPQTGTTHTFFVVAVDVTGEESPASDTIRYTITDQTPPSPPPNVRTQVPEGEVVVLNWSISPEPDVEGYHVYRASRVVEEGRRLTDQLLPLDSTRHVDSTFTGGGRYIYKVTAVDSAGNESPRGRGAQAFVNDRTPPAPPTGLRARFDSTTGQARLAWQRAPSAEDFSGYVLVRSKAGEDGALFSRLDSAGVEETSFTDQGPAGQGFREGARYRYGVAARDEAKNYSDTTFVTLKVPNRTPPAAPTRLSARSPDGLDVDHRWTAPPDRDVVAYRLYRRPGDTSDTAGATMPDTALARLSSPTTFFEDTTATAGRTYVYRVSAVDSVGQEGPRSTPVQFTLRDDAPPRPIRNVRAVVPDTTGSGPPGVRITWGPVAAPDLDGYRVERAGLPTGAYEPVHETAPDTTTWTDPGGTIGTWYRVRALDTSGNPSRPGEPAQAQPAADAPQ